MLWCGRAYGFLRVGVNYTDVVERGAGCVVGGVRGVMSCDWDWAE